MGAHYGRRYARGRRIRGRVSVQELVDPRRVTRQCRGERWTGDVPLAADLEREHECTNGSTDKE
jgi:hypothetical protein